MHPFTSKEIQITVHLANVLLHCKIMSSRGASQGFHDSAVSQDSQVPYFDKTITHAMLQRGERLGIPMQFIHKYGDKLHTALSLTGPNGHSRRVTLKVRTYDTDTRHSVSVFLAHGWKDFVTENGFRMGDRVIFRLVGKSSFHVLLCTRPLSESGPLVPSACLPTARPLGNYANVTPFDAPLHPTLTSTNEVMMLVNLNPTERCLQVEPLQWNSPDNTNTISVKKRNQSSRLRKQDYLKHPELNSTINSSSKFPHFVTKLTGSNLCGCDIRLELPHRFVEEHADKFQTQVFLLGPSGRPWRVSLRIAPYGLGKNRVQLRKGWREFARENGFKRGDMLLFALVGLSKFVVQIFP